MFVKEIIAMLQKKDPNENICACIIDRVDVADYSTCYDALKDKPLTGEELDEIIDDLDEVDLDMGLGWEAVSCCIEDIIENERNKMPDDYGNEYLAEQCGYKDEMEMLEKATFDSVADGVCPICGYTSRVEPDCDDGWCEECEANTVKSCLIIAGML